MDIIVEILRNTSLWEITTLLIVIYFIFQPEILKNITKFKFGQFELEMNTLKEEVKKGNDKITSLELELKSDRLQLDKLRNSFDPNASVGELGEARKSIKSQARNLSEISSLSEYLNMDSSSEQLYIAAVGIRETRPVKLLPNLISFLELIAASNTLGGYRLNTIWTLTSALHKILISCIRDDIEPLPDKNLLLQARNVLQKLENNPRVQQDRPDAPNKGIRGPIKDSSTWVEKGLTQLKKNGHEND
jgi:DNA integrity scanning protein DisA with diadenylate cyclase activity